MFCNSSRGYFKIILKTFHEQCVESGVLELFLNLFLIYFRLFINIMCS